MDRGSYLDKRERPKPFKKKKGKKAKWLSEEALQILRNKRSKSQRRKGKTYPTECRAPENSKER